jgi:hypothetical protein
MTKGLTIKSGWHLISRYPRRSLRSRSVIVTVAALMMFGYGKGSFTGAPPLRSALYTTLIGGLAAGAAFIVARAIM